MNVLYVCNDFPYPPHHGALVDMWNRIKSFSELGVSLEVIATVKSEPTAQNRATVEEKVAGLRTIPRHSLWPTLVSGRPGQAAVRSALRFVPLGHEYDLVLMQSEYTSDILRNPDLKFRHSAIRVDNDESAYALRAARAEKSLVRKAYFLQDSLKVRHYTNRILPAADSLWFVSHDEMKAYQHRQTDSHVGQRVRFVPAGIDTSCAMQPTLVGTQVLFVGNMSGSLNRLAIEWYVRNVHPLLSDVPGYRLVIAGSTRGKSAVWLQDLTAGLPNISTHLDQPDLTPFYEQSAVFVNPMQEGAGVKLKTVESCVRGLPVVSTDTGAEGSGLVQDIHFKRANTPLEFAAHVRSMLMNKDAAKQMAIKAQQFILGNYDQKIVMQRLLAELESRKAA